MFVESAWTKDGGIEEVWSVCCSDNEDLVGGGYVHLHEQFCYYSIHDGVGVSTVASFGDECIEFIHEDDAGFGGDSSLEDLSNIFLTLSYVHVE